jgi:hypothetical protein
MKPYRVKRGGKLIGNLLVVHDGKRVNLGTKDQNEARRRIELLVKGEWPPRDEVDAARAVKQALDPAAPSPEVLTPPPEVYSPVPPAVASPIPVPPPAMPPAMPAMDAVNAAAAAEDEIEREATQAMRSLGVDLGELAPKLPEYVGKGVVALSGQLARVPVRFIAGAWVETPKLPEEAAPLVPVMGRCLLMKLAQWGIDLEKLGPGAWLLVTFGICVTLQVAVGLSAVEAAKAATPKTPDLRPVP